MARIKSRSEFEVEGALRFFAAQDPPADIMLYFVEAAMNHVSGMQRALSGGTFIGNHISGA